MRIIIILLFCVSIAGAQNLPLTPSITPPPPKDPAKCIIMRLGFENNLTTEPSDIAGLSINFSRSSISYAEGIAVSENSPRFVEGKTGKALLLESAYANLFSVAQSSCSETSAFNPLQGATLAISAERPWQGKETLAVTTRGEKNEEGFAAELSVELAFYTREIPAIVPAYYVASLYLRGEGNLKILLKDTDSSSCGEPVYVSLTPEWQRFSCTFGYKFNRINIGPKHDADWKNSLPPGTNIGAKLQFICTTVDSSKSAFFADGLQIEKRHLASGTMPEISPHSWILGGLQTAQEQLAIIGTNAAFNAWTNGGTIAFWFKPLWEVRDGSSEIIWQMTPNQMMLAHSSSKISFSPAGVSFTPSDWKGSWHHIAMTWNKGGERFLYIDGMEYHDTSGKTAPVTEPQSLLAGDFIRNLAPNGAIDDLILYSAQLTAEQLKNPVSVETGAR